MCWFYLKTELIPNDDFTKPNSTLEFSPEEFEQLLEIQQDLLDTMEDETLSNGEYNYYTQLNILDELQLFGE